MSGLCVLMRDRTDNFMVARNRPRHGCSDFTVRDEKGTKLKFCRPE